MDVLVIQSFGEGVMARLSGPGRARFIVQPLVAIALGIRDGIADAKQNKPPYMIRLLFKSERKMFVLKTGLKSISKPLAAGIILDMILQWVIYQAVRLYPALIAGALLIALPYAIARGWSNRIVQPLLRRKEAQAEAAHATAAR